MTVTNLGQANLTATLYCPCTKNFFKSMLQYKQLSVRTEKGKPDSLKEPVKIALVITHAEPEGPAHPYDPIARVVTRFIVDGEHSVGTSWWKWRYHFGNTELTGRKVTWSNLSEPLKPGNAVLLTNGWGPPIERGGLGPASIMAINQSGSKQTWTLGFCMAFHPLDNGGSITIPCRRNLQVYIVSDEINAHDILQPEDLHRPIFPTPLDCDALPDDSTWILCRDRNGAIRLKNDEYSHLGYPTQAAVEETPVERAQPAQIADLSQIVERLTKMEESIALVRDNVAFSQKAMAGMQSQLSALEKSTSDANGGVSDLNAIVGVMETRAKALAESFGQSQVRLSTVQNATAGMQQVLKGLGQTVSNAGDQLLDLNCRIPAIESEAERMTTSLTHTDSRLSAVEEDTSRIKKHVEVVEKSASQTQEQVSLVQQLVVATNSQLSLMKQIPGGVAVGAPLLAQTQTSNVNDRLPVVEAQVEKLEKTLGQTQKQLVSVRNTLYSLDRRVPVVESKSDKLEVSLGRAQADLIAVQVSLASLDRRVTVAEVRSGEVEIDDDGGSDGPGDVGNHSSPSARGSPVTFPSYPIGSPPRSGGLSS